MGKETWVLDALDLFRGFGSPLKKIGCNGRTRELYFRKRNECMVAFIWKILRR